MCTVWRIEKENCVVVCSWIYWWWCDNTSGAATNTPALHWWCVRKRASAGRCDAYVFVSQSNTTCMYSSIFVFLLFTSLEVISTSLHFSNFNNHIGAAAEQPYQLLIISYFDYFHLFEFIFVKKKNKKKKERKTQILFDVQLSLFVG